MFEKLNVYSGKFVLNILGCDQRLGVVETVRQSEGEGWWKRRRGQEGGLEFSICIYLFFCNHKYIAYQFKTVKL